MFMDIRDWGYIMAKKKDTISWIILFPFKLTYYGYKKKNKPALIIGALLSVLLIWNLIFLETEASSDTQTIVDSELFDGYTLIEVEGGNLSGYRESNVVVDIGYGDREYWAFTNEYGQLVRVVADVVTLQDHDTEDVNSEGRYYPDEAKVPGVEAKDLDEGHVLADSLGGVANAYNITPQDSYLNRHGDQAYMEKFIRENEGCTHFEAIISYPDTKTQIPSHYKISYTVAGQRYVDEFYNVNPDNENSYLRLTGEDRDISWVDTNGNGIVTIKEAEAVGFEMPITSEHWLYEFMVDTDGDGVIGN
jgi:hypothetical protein